MEGCNNLQYVDCAYNDLTSLSLTNLTFLQRLICNNNQLNMLDLSFDTQLQYVNCRNNVITDLRTIGCDNLGMLACRWFD